MDVTRPEGGAYHGYALGIIVKFVLQDMKTSMPGAFAIGRCRV
jgi:hypothetical protein